MENGYELLGILWYITFGWLTYFYIISPIFKKPEQMELVDVIEGDGGSFSFFFAGSGIFLMVAYAIYATFVPFFCVAQFLTGHAMGVGPENEFVFRKENGEIISLRMRKDDLKFFGSSNYVIGDICKVKYMKHMLQRIKIDKKNRMEIYKQAYGKQNGEPISQQEQPTMIEDAKA